MSKKEEIPLNKKWEGENFLKLLGKLHDPRFGDITLYENTKTGLKIMSKEKQSGDKIQFTKDIEMAKMRTTLVNENLHKMLGWSTVTKSELCSTHHYVKMFFEHPKSDLRNEVAQRRRAGVSLSSDELSTATTNSLNCLDYLHSKKLAHGDIRPQLISAEKIGPTEQLNQFKLLDRLADPSPIAKVQINRMIAGKELYMSPQLWKHINTKGKVKPKWDRQKNDLFSLGMSLLSAGNATSLKSCYKKDGTFDSNKKEEQLERFKSERGDNYALCNVVSYLLEEDEEQRPDIDMILGRKQMVSELPQENYEQKEEVQEIVTNTQFARPEYEVESSPVYVENVVETHRPHVVSQNVEVRHKAPEVTNLGGKVKYGEPKILRTYVDESSRRSYRGQQDKKSMIVPPSPRYVLDNEGGEEYKNAAQNNFSPQLVAENLNFSDVPVEGKLVRRTIIVKDDKGNEIERVEKPIHH